MAGAPLQAAITQALVQRQNALLTEMFGAGNISSNGTAGIPAGAADPITIAVRNGASDTTETFANRAALLSRATAMLNQANYFGRPTSGPVTPLNLTVPQEQAVPPALGGHHQPDSPSCGCLQFDAATGSAYYLVCPTGQCPGRWYREPDALANQLNLSNEDRGSCRPS
ncbi:MAG: hypothetical protein R2857_08345 [Vampirovibrionales bacterium]